MDKERKELIIHITMTVITTLVMGYIIFFVVAPDIDSGIQITMTNDNPIDIVDALIRFLPVAIIGGLIIIALPRRSLDVR